MASVPSVTSSLAGFQSVLGTVALSETTATTNGSNPLAQPAGEVTVDFYQSANEAQAAQILGMVGWKPYSDSYDENAALAVVNDGSGTTYLGNYSDRQGTHSYSDATWDSTEALDDPTQGLTAAYSVVLERDSPDTVSATITAADGTTSTIELNVPEDAPSLTAAGTPSTPAASAAAPSAPAPTSAPAAPVAPLPEPLARSVPAKAPHATPVAVAATTILGAGGESLSLSFDDNGDFSTLFTSKNAGVTSFLGAGASYGSVLAVGPGSTLNLSG